VYEPTTEIANKQSKASKQMEDGIINPLRKGSLGYFQAIKTEWAKSPRDRRVQPLATAAAAPTPTLSTTGRRGAATATASSGSCVAPATSSSSPSPSAPGSSFRGGRRDTTRRRKSTATTTTPFFQRNAIPQNTNDDVTTAPTATAAAAAATATSTVVAAATIGTASTTWSISDAMSTSSSTAPAGADQSAALFSFGSSFLPQQELKTGDVAATTASTGASAETATTTTSSATFFSSARPFAFGDARTSGTATSRTGMFGKGSDEDKATTATAVSESNTQTGGFGWRANTSSASSIIFGGGVNSEGAKTGVLGQLSGETTSSAAKSPPSTAGTAPVTSAFGTSAGTYTFGASVVPTSAGVPSFATIAATPCTSTPSAPFGGFGSSAGGSFASSDTGSTQFLGPSTAPSGFQNSGLAFSLSSRTPNQPAVGDYYDEEGGEDNDDADQCYSSSSENSDQTPSSRSEVDSEEENYDGGDGGSGQTASFGPRTAVEGTSSTTGAASSSSFTGFQGLSVESTTPPGSGSMFGLMPVAGTAQLSGSGFKDTSTGAFLSFATPATKAPFGGLGLPEEASSKNTVSLLEDARNEQQEDPAPARLHCAPVSTLDATYIPFALKADKAAARQSKKEEEMPVKEPKSPPKLDKKLFLPKENWELFDSSLHRRSASDPEIPTHVRSAMKAIRPVANFPFMDFSMEPKRSSAEASPGRYAGDAYKGFQGGARPLSPYELLLPAQMLPVKAPNLASPEVRQVAHMASHKRADALISRQQALRSKDRQHEKPMRNLASPEVEQASPVTTPNRSDTVVSRQRALRMKARQYEKLRQKTRKSPARVVVVEEDLRTNKAHPSEESPVQQNCTPTPAETVPSPARASKKDDFLLTTEAHVHTEHNEETVAEWRRQMAMYAAHRSLEICTPERVPARTAGTTTSSTRTSTPRTATPGSTPRSGDLYCGNRRRPATTTPRRQRKYTTIFDDAFYKKSMSFQQMYEEWRRRQIAAQEEEIKRMAVFKALPLPRTTYEPSTPPRSPATTSHAPHHRPHHHRPQQEQPRFSTPLRGLRIDKTDSSGKTHRSS